MLDEDLTLERVCVIEKTAAAALAGWTLEKIDKATKRDELRPTAESLSTDVAAVYQEVYSQSAFQHKFGDGQDISSWFDLRICGGGFVSTPMLLSVMKQRSFQQGTVVQARLAHKKSCSRVFEAALLNAPDAVANQSSLAVNSHLFLYASLQKIVAEFFMRILGHVRADGSVFCASLSEHSIVAATMSPQRQEDNLWVIARGLGHARSPPELVANDVSASGGSSSSNGDGNASSGASTYSIQRPNSRWFLNSLDTFCQSFFDTIASLFFFVIHDSCLSAVCSPLPFSYF